jgi:membrane protease YdiL (CAAX protease family)
MSSEFANFLQKQFRMPKRKESGILSPNFLLQCYAMNTKFLESKKGLLLQIFLVFLPPVFVLKSVYLFPAMVISLALAWGMIHLRNKTWKDVGFRKPERLGRLLLITLVATAILFPVSSAIIHVVKEITATAPNLEAFEILRGNPGALAGGLVIAWIFGAFIEELLFRGFLLNTLNELFSKEGCPQYLTWTAAVLITSVFTGIGHTYQGIVGMVGTGFIAVGFSAIYLLNRRNLWSCILAHGLYDTVAFVLVYKGIIV